MDAFRIEKEEGNNHGNKRICILYGRGNKKYIGN